MVQEKRGWPTRASLTGITLVAFGAFGGCGQAAPVESAGARGQTEPAVGQAAQALVSAPACVTISRPGAAGTVFDAQIYNQGLNNNFGGVQTFVAGTVGSLQRQALIQFDLGAIPAGPGTNITSATLSLVQSITGKTGPETLNVHRVTSPWSEGTVTWASFAGGFDPAIWSTFTNASASPVVDVTALVAAWTHGAVANHGLLIESPLNATSYWSSEYGAPPLRPTLSVCFTVTCPLGTADCNNNGLDGCEADVGSSVLSCGGCGTVCNVPNAAPACVNAACAVGACNLGFGDCNGDPADGCETLLTTAANCGACGVACALPNAASSCASGSCALTACNAGHYDCDGNPGNGCEATPCADGSHCASAAGCTSGVCANGFCAAPVCSDGAKNGTETAVDCGGGACPPCAVGLACNAGSDCTTGVCQGGVCAAAACNDGVKNGAETAVDCGGGACPPCASGQGCLAGSDCTGGVCTAGVCQAPTCNDGLANGNETAVDCGGGVCPACVAGKSCNLGADCADGVCTGNVCQLASCSDGVKNGSETDVDCGGPCPPCNVAARCATSADCGSDVCVAGFCQAPTCNDGVKNGNETGVDCGGSCFKPEVCNGVDDDCNGLVDDGLGSTTCGVGACQVTVPNCVGGQVQTCVPLPPHPESCDGLIDDDCDGVVDNGCACTDGRTQSCYTAAPSTLGVGLCQAGVQTCAHGQWGACAGEVTPSVETCDGLDNDCNGVVDDGLGQTVCGVGGCQVTTANCVGGQPQTCTPSAPQPETCDGIDNDCNGVVDDDLPATTCGVGACQRTAPSCVNGQPGACVPGAPSPEACDGIDNDCDGVVDNGDPGSGQGCSTGKLGACAAGVTACSNGGIVCNQTVQPHAEICNGVDDDCDGVVDNGNPGGNAACTTGNKGVCGAGTTVCAGGHLSCSQTVQPTAETCDGLDNDCDGVVDNGNPGGGQPCSTTGLGVCTAGTTACLAGASTCVQNVQATAETCNGLDDNCNGAVDDGAAVTCPTPAHAAAACTAGACGLGACNAGFGNCDGLASTGCEANLNTDSANCGSCGHGCNGGACTNGTCANACLSAANDPVTGQKCPILAPCTQYADCGTQNTVNNEYWYCSSNVCQFQPQVNGFTAAAGSCAGNLLIRQDTGAPFDKRIVPPDGVNFREGTTLTIAVTNQSASDLYLDQIPLTIDLAGTNPSAFDVSNIKMYEVGSIADYGDGNNGGQLVCISPATPFLGGSTFILGTGATGGCGGSSFSRIPHGGTTRFIIDLAFAASETYIANRQYRLKLAAAPVIKARTSTAGSAATVTSCVEPTAGMTGSYLIFKTP